MPPGRSSNTTLGLALISAGSLAFEISLTRLFAVQQFHHFAFVVISLAVLGIAASGMLLALRPRHPPLAALALAYAISIMLAYLTVNFLPFDSYSIIWDSQQVWILLLHFVTAGAPFLFAGWTVGACLADAGPEAYRPYAANLVGSAIGCPVALAALALVGGEGAVALAVALGFFAALTFSNNVAFRVLAAILTALALMVAIHPPDALTLRLSPYKPLSVTRLALDAQTTFTEWSASTRVDVVESRSIHVFPGLSLNSVAELPQQVALFIDGDGPIPISDLLPDASQARTLANHMPGTLAYRLRPNAQTLILLPGAGLDAVLALAAGAGHVTIAMDEPLIRDILSGPYSEFSKDIIDHPRLSVIDRPSRSALYVADQRHDVVQFALSQTYRPVFSGAFSLTEEYSLTVESLVKAYDRLNDNGLLMITRWLSTPPSEAARAWSTLLAVLRTYGVDDLKAHVIAYRGMRTATMIASKKPFTDSELSGIRDFLNANAFDPIILPDLDPAELNRYNRLPMDTYHEIFSALLNDPASTIADYEFSLKPPTDSRPFFFHFFRWRQTPDVIATLGLTWQPFGGSGYLVILALLGLMLVLTIPLILVPLLLLSRGASWTAPGFSVLSYFACLGAGYLLVEIPLIQRLTLLLERPAIALAVVLFTLLLASGVGSLLSAKVNLRIALAILVLLLIMIIILLPTIIDMALPWVFSARVALSVAVLTPLGILMGVPFAAGLRWLETSSPGSIPWAWATNGAISGLSGVLAALISLDAGLMTTLFIGALVYFGAWITAPKLMASKSTNLRLALGSQTELSNRSDHN